MLSIWFHGSLWLPSFTFIFQTSKFRVECMSHWAIRFLFLFFTLLHFFSKWQNGSNPVNYINLGEICILFHLNHELAVDYFPRKVVELCLLWVNLWDFSLQNIQIGVDQLLIILIYNRHSEESNKRCWNVKKLESYCLFSS